MKKYYMLLCSLFMMSMVQGQTNVIDFTSPNTVTFGEGAQVLEDGIMMLRAGNANGDGVVKYHETDGDVAAMINRVGETTQSLMPFVYSDEDVNLDGYVKLNGADNDRVFLLNIVGFFTPFYVIQEQLP